MNINQNLFDYLALIRRKKKRKNAYYGRIFEDFTIIFWRNPFSTEIRLGNPSALFFTLSKWLHPVYSHLHCGTTIFSSRGNLYLVLFVCLCVCVFVTHLMFQEPTELLLDFLCLYIPSIARVNKIIFLSTILLCVGSVVL